MLNQGRARTSKTQERDDQESQSSLLGVIRHFLWLSWNFLKQLKAKSWIFAFIVAAILAIALSTYSPLDGAFSVSALDGNDEVTNALGVLGAYVSDIFYMFFGHSAWLFVLGFIAVGYYGMRPQVYRKGVVVTRDSLKYVEAFVGFWWMLIGAMLVEAINHSFSRFPLPGEPGGVWGASMAKGLEPYVPSDLLTVLGVMSFFVGLSMLMTFSWIVVVERVGRNIMKLVWGRRGKDAHLYDDDEEVAKEPPSVIAQGPEPEIVTAQPAPESERTEVVPVRKVAPLHSELPSLQVLPVSKVRDTHPNENIILTSRILVAKLFQLNIQAEIATAYPGLMITQYCVRVMKPEDYKNAFAQRLELKRLMGVKSLRMVPEGEAQPLQFRIELPNLKVVNLLLRDLLNTEAFEKSASPLTLALGAEIFGSPFMVDLAKAPHILMVGDEATQKDQILNTMLVSLLYKNTSEQLKLLLIDPSSAALMSFNGLKHLCSPVINDVHQASQAIFWLRDEMERRLALLKTYQQSNLTTFNAYAQKHNQRVARRGSYSISLTPVKAESKLETMPYLMGVIHEIIPLLNTDQGREVTRALLKLCQKARLVGIHLVVTTSDPGHPAFTNVLQANFPQRMVFHLLTRSDSRSLLEDSDADELLDQGDFLFKTSLGVKRYQAAMTDRQTVKAVVEDILKKAGTSFSDSITPSSVDYEHNSPLEEGEYEFILRFVSGQTAVSAALLERELKISHEKALWVLGLLERNQVIGSRDETGIALVRTAFWKK